MLRAHGVTEKGPVRPTNEDCFAIDEALRLLVLADGMGGHNAGEVAARIAVDAVVDSVRDHAEGGPGGREWPFGFDPSLSLAGNLLRTAIHRANMAVLETAVGEEAFAGMGTTIVAALVDGGRVSVAHVGDSRCYLLAESRLRQLTHDDSWMATVLAEHPDADPALLLHHPMRNVLTNVVGAGRAADVHVVEESLSGGERLALSTDGVHSILDEGTFRRHLAGVTLEQAASDLVAAALARGSRDNCTAIVASYLP